MNASIISCAARTEARNLTIPQLEHLGITVQTYISPCDPASGKENARVSSLALTDAKDRGGPLLFCEDDIDLAPTFAHFLQAACDTDAIVYFYMHERPGRMLETYGIEAFNGFTKKRHLPPGLYEAQTRIWLYNTQCVYLPESVIREFDIGGLVTRDRPPFQSAFDTVLKNWLQERQDIPVMIALPNPVQHRNDRTGRTENKSGAFKRSKTFEMWMGGAKRQA